MGYPSCPLSLVYRRELSVEVGPRICRPLKSRNVFDDRREAADSLFLVSNVWKLAYIMVRGPECAKAYRHAPEGEESGFEHSETKYFPGMVYWR